MDLVTNNDSPELKLHFLDYWRVIRLRRSLILVVFLLCVVTSTLLTIWLPKSYSSSLDMRVQKDDPEVALNGEMHAAFMSTDPYFLTTEFKVLESYRILTNVIRTLDLEEKLAQQNGETRWALKDTFDYLLKRVSVDQTRMTSLIQITVRNPDRELAAKIANQMADSYRAFRIDQWKGTKGRGVEALEARLATNAAELSEAQSKLDKDRNRLHISELEEGMNSEMTIMDKGLEEWAHTRVGAQTDYLEYGNILYP